MNIINNCSNEKIAKKEIDKCKKFVEEVLSKYDIKYKIIIEECGDHWFKTKDNLTELYKDDKVHCFDKDIIFITNMFWIKDKNNRFILCS